MKLRAILPFVLLVAAVGCEDAPPPPPTGGGGGSSSEAGGGGGAMTAGGGSTNAGGGGSPMTDAGTDAGETDGGATCDESITVTLRDGLTGAAPIIHASDFTVGCEFGQTDLASATLTITDGDDVSTSADLNLNGGTGVHELDIDPTNFASGGYRFVCRAETAAGACGTASAEIFVDRGPELTLNVPQFEALVSGTVDVEFVALASALFDGDEDFEVTNVTATVAGATLTNLTEGASGRWSGSISVVDDTIFPTPPEGDQAIVITATNERGTVRVVESTIVVDNVGPVIEFVTPEENEIVGRRLRVLVRIEDESGVDDDLVFLNPGSMLDPVPLTPDPQRDGQYFASVPLDELETTVQSITLEVNADDLAGNTGEATRMVPLDFTPPLISLDPPDVIVIDNISSRNECSPWMDPLGNDAPDDREVVGTGAYFRARVDDQGNGGFGVSSTFISAIPDDGVRIYVKSASDPRPLLVDTDSDGFCDAINPDLDPAEPTSTNPAALLSLDPTTPENEGPYYGNVDGDDNPGNASNTPDDVPVCTGDVDDEGVFCCTDNNNATGLVGTQLCDVHSEAWTIIYAPLTLDDRIPAVYGLETVQRQSTTDPTRTCLGSAYDFQSDISPGWACVAGVALDEADNLGVSAPLRSCFTNGTGPNPCGGFELTEQAPEGHPSLPTCTDGCIPRPSYAAGPGSPYNIIYH